MKQINRKGVLFTRVEYRQRNHKTYKWETKSAILKLSKK